VGSPCHPCRTTFYFSYSFFSLKLPPPPCAVIVVIPTAERMKPDETPPTPRIKYNHVMYGDKFANICEMMKPDPNRNVYNRVVFVRPKWYLTHIFTYTHTYIYTYAYIFAHTYIPTKYIYIRLIKSQVQKFFSPVKSEPLTSRRTRHWTLAPRSLGGHFGSQVVHQTSCNYTACMYV
jgi:hypothetical protein